MSGMALSLHELRKLPDDEVVRRYDAEAKTTVVGTQYYQDELNRRYQERQTVSMLRFTRWITVMTGVVTVATIVNVVLATVLLSCQ